MMEGARKFAIWQSHEVTGYIDLTPEQADQLNGIHGIGAYFGADDNTRRLEQKIKEDRKEG